MSRRYLSKVAADISIRLSVIIIAILFFIFAAGFMAAIGFVTVIVSGFN